MDDLSKVVGVLERILATLDRIEKKLGQERQVPSRQELRRLVGVEVRRLGWQQEHGKKVLKALYSKDSTEALSDMELANFLRYLISLNP